MTASGGKGYFLPVYAVITAGIKKLLFLQFVPHQSRSTVDRYVFGQFGR